MTEFMTTFWLLPLCLKYAKANQTLFKTFSHLLHKKKHNDDPCLTRNFRLHLQCKCSLRSLGILRSV